MKRITMLFPGGKSKCLTMSYDDGQRFDRRLVRIFNAHGIRGTFNLNSGRLGGICVEAEEVPRLYAGHEVASHTVTHPHPTLFSPPALLPELTEDRAALEALVGYPVRGFAYPYGEYNADVLRALQSAGLEYARTVNSTHQFSLPADFLQWHPTCHHDDGRLMELGQRLISSQGEALQLMYVWGHSFEFDRNDNWQRMEDFCAMMGGREDIWYATNIQIADAVEGFRRLRFSQDNSIIFNPSAQAVWIAVDGSPLQVPGGAMIRI